jgi:hypothetical protein
MGDGTAAVATLIYDPLEPREDPAFRNVLLLSILLHLVALFLFWDTILGAVFEKEDTAIVRMEEVERQQKPQRKVIAQKMLDTKVRRFQQVHQQQIEEIRPELMSKMERIEVAQLENIEAPKTIQRQNVVTKRVNAFAEKPVASSQVSVPKAAPQVRKATRVQASAGPRKIEAAGPNTDPQAVDIDAPLVARGMVSNEAVQGDTTGAKIRALESGTSDAYLQGDDGKGTLWGGSADCMKDPICLEYLKMIESRVFQRWAIPPDTDAGKVVLAFRIDRGGAALGVKVRSADDPVLGQSCEAAFRHASPFPPPPEKIRYIVNKGIKATFRYGD